MKILGIDDNEDINLWLKDVLESEDHEFTYVTNGKDGLQLIRDQTFDAIILDLAMPGFSGRQVVDALDKEDLLNKQPVILFTASSVTESEIEGMINQGVQRCIRKPVEIDTILGAIENLQKK